MKYLVMGHSGSGKSTLTKIISQVKNIPLLYLDCVHFESNWKAKSDDEARKTINDFMRNNDSWVIDGNYFKLELEERIKQANVIIFLDFNRINCLLRAYKRYFEYKGKDRESITKGCYEVMDAAFIDWILRGERTKERKNKYKEILNTPQKLVIILKNQKQLDKFINTLHSGKSLESIM